MSSWFVVKAESCPKCDVELFAECDVCDGEGITLDVSSAIPVEPSVLMDSDYGIAEPVHCFVPVESSSSGEGGDQWPEATGASAAEREEVAAHEVDASPVAEAPEGTQPPGLSDGDER